MLEEQQVCLHIQHTPIREHSEDVILRDNFLKRSFSVQHCQFEVPLNHDVP